jgi:type II secretory pathway component PulF
MRTRTEKAAGITGLVSGVAAALIPLRVVPEFSEVFRAFGADLPLITRVFVHHAWVFWLIPAAVLLAWFAWPNPRHRALAAALIGTVGLLLMVPTTVLAMYLPIFRLGAAVG